MKILSVESSAASCSVALSDNGVLIGEEFTNVKLTQDVYKRQVLRHPENRKWFALVMRVSKSKFGIKSDNAVDI